MLACPLVLLKHACGSETVRTRCELFLSVEDLKLLFLKDPENMWVGKKGDMVLELVKMLYFDYTLETEVSG